MKEKFNSMLVLVLVIRYDVFLQGIKSSTIDKHDLLILKDMDKELMYISISLKKFWVQAYNNYP